MPRVRRSVDPKRSINALPSGNFGFRHAAKTRHTTCRPGLAIMQPPACPGPWAWLFLLHDSTPNGRLDGEYITATNPG